MARPPGGLVGAVVPGESYARSAPRRRGLSLAGLLSLTLHLLLLAAVILPLLLRRRPALVPPPQQAVRVALVLKEQKGAGHPNLARAVPAPPSVRKQPPPPPPLPVPPETPPPAAAGVPLPPPVPHPPIAAPTKPPHPAPPAPQPAPPTPAAPHGFQFNLGGNNPETNAIVTGGDIVPATPDGRFRNREPAYPLAAAERGEQGTVVLMIHVGPDGRPTRVEVQRSSGFRLLDRAARDAVAGWHFLPAIRNGQPVAAAMPLRVVFSLD
ncbi:MAG: energy transducer TonB [Rhodospirillales bacterium]|nr:energy transducer TonB [Rhodospirillales bacterium]